MISIVYTFILTSYSNFFHCLITRFHALNCNTLWHRRRLILTQVSCKIIQHCTNLYEALANMFFCVSYYLYSTSTINSACKMISLSTFWFFHTTCLKPAQNQLSDSMNVGIGTQLKCDFMATWNILHPGSDDVFICQQGAVLVKLYPKCVCSPCILFSVEIMKSSWKSVQKMHQPRYVHTQIRQAVLDLTKNVQHISFSPSPCQWNHVLSRPANTASA